MRICRNAARKHNIHCALGFKQKLKTGVYRFDKRLGKGCRDVCLEFVVHNTSALCSFLMNHIDNGGLQSREGKIVFGTVDTACLEFVFVFIADRRKSVHCRAAGIGKTQHTRAFVKSFARGIVSCTSDKRIFGIIVNAHKRGMSARNYERNEGGLQILVHKIVCRNVTSYMMHGYKRLSGCKSQSLCKRKSGKQRADKTGRIGNRDSIDIVHSKACLGKRAFNHAANSFGMCTRSDFGHNTTVYRVDIYLRGNHARQ